MTWLTSLPAAVLVVGGLAFALLVAIGGRLAVRALVPAAERDAAYAIAAPLMPALGALFALFMGLTLASEAGFLASAQGIVSNEAADASRLAWAATSPGVNSAPIQSALLGYLRATRANEWRQQRGRRRRSRHRARHRQPGECRPGPIGPPGPRDTREHRAAGLPRCPDQRSSRPPGRGLTSAPRPLRRRPGPHRGGVDRECRTRGRTERPSRAHH